MTLQVDIPNDFLRRLTRVYELKYDMANVPVQNITEQDVLEFLDEALNFIDGSGSLKEKKKRQADHQFRFPKLSEDRHLQKCNKC